MKNFFLVLFITLTSMSIFAQKVKVDNKRGIMTIDKVDVSKFKSEKGKDRKQTFTFTDLNSDDYVTFDLITPDDGFKSYFIVTSSLSDKNSEIEYELISFTLSNVNVVTNLAVKKYKFFTPEGMEKQAIINYLNTENRAISEANLAIKAKENEKQERINAYSPVINSNQTVTNKNTKELIASFEKIKEDPNALMIKDQKGNNIARLTSKIAMANNGLSNTKEEVYDIETYNNKVYSFKPDGRKDPKLTAIETLILNDYMGNDANAYEVRQAFIKEHNDKIIAETEKIEAENTKRSLVENGIITLANGEVKEGSFRVEFRQTPEGRITKIGGEGNIKNLDGVDLEYFYKDEKGKDKGKFYTLKQITSFKITSNESGNEELYVKENYVEEPVSQEKAGIISNEGSIDLVGFGKGLLGGKPKDKVKTALLYVASDNPKTTLYFFNDKIYIKDKKTNRIILLNKQFENQLEKIAEGCPSTIHNVQSGMFEYTLESILGFTEELEDCQ